jgi:hypothetical protein
LQDAHGRCAAALARFIRRRNHSEVSG